MFDFPGDLIIHLYFASLGGFMGALVAFLFILFSVLMLFINRQDRYPLSYLPLEIIFIPFLFGFGMFFPGAETQNFSLWVKMSFGAFVFISVALRLITNWILKDKNNVDIFFLSIFGFIWNGLIWFFPRWFPILLVVDRTMVSFPFYTSGIPFAVLLFDVSGLLFWDWGRLLLYYRKHAQIHSEMRVLMIGVTFLVWLLLFDVLALLQIIPWSPLFWVGPFLMLFFMGIYYAQTLRFQTLQLETMSKEKDYFYQQLIRDDLTATYSRNYFSSILKTNL